MAQFHVYRLPNKTLVLDIQTDLIDIGTRIVAPLVPLKSGPPPLTRLEPIFDLDGTSYVLHVAELAAVRSSALSSPAIADLTDRDYEIRSALDMVFSGF